MSIAQPNVSAQPSPIREFIDAWVDAVLRPHHATGVPVPLDVLTAYPVPPAAWDAFGAWYGDPPRVDDPKVAYAHYIGHRIDLIEQILAPDTPHVAQMAMWFEVEVTDAAVGLNGNVDWDIHRSATWDDEAHGRARDQARHQACHLVILLAPGWTPDPKWRTETVLALARGIVADRAFDRMRILADALEEAGCDDHEWLTLMRDPEQSLFTLMRDPEQSWFAAAGVLRSLV